MINLDYLKVGSYIKQSVTGCYSGSRQINIIEVKELKINKKSAWVNGYKYEIVGNQLYSKGDGFVIIISEVDAQIEDKIKDELEQELVQLKKSFEYIHSLIEDAQKVKTIKEIEDICRKLKTANKKITLNLDNWQNAVYNRLFIL